MDNIENQVTTSDVDELERLYLKAKKSLREIEWVGFYPRYPEPISSFMKYITSSPWCNPNYKPEETKKLIDEIETADLISLRSILTAASRGERFCDGHWKSVIESERIESVIKRAREIIIVNK
ncbi:MAG: hypothetical protein GTO20_07360 [Candidatus Aminicenantes bacterium]|nr:hypothetical protein [Candidatus Aminicenantes bacterium]